MSSSGDGKNGILGIAQVVVQGAHAVGISTGKISVLAELLVQLIELRLAHILVGENLHHPLAVDHFLHIAVHRAQGTLLADEKLGGFSRNQLGDEHHRQHGNQLKHRQDGRGDNHRDEHHHQGHHRGSALGNGLGDHLPEGIDVAGVAAHDVAGGMGVKVANGQGLHVGEQLIPDGTLGALADLGHQVVAEEGGHKTNEIHTGHHAQKAQQWGKIRNGLGQHRGDIVIHQGSQRGRAGRLSHRAEHNAHAHHCQGTLVLSHIGKKPRNGLLGVFCHAAVAAHFHRRHYSIAPFVWDS